jgi:hypothetical protein
MPNYRFGRCDGRHEIIDFGLGRARCPWRAPRRRLHYGAGQIFLCLWYTAYCPPSWRPAILTASSGAGSGSPVGFLTAMCIRATLAARQQDRKNGVGLDGQG